MRSFSYTYWLVVPRGSSANSRLAEYFNQFMDDRFEEHVRCQNGSGTIVQSGWRADSFAAELKPVLRSFTTGEIAVYRCASGSKEAVPWRSGILRYLPRRSRYSKPRRGQSATGKRKAVH